MLRGMLCLLLAALLSERLGAVRPAQDEDFDLKAISTAKSGKILFLASGKAFARRDDDGPLEASTAGRLLVEQRMDKLRTLRLASTQGQNTLGEYARLFSKAEVAYVAPTESAMATFIVAVGKLLGGAVFRANLPNAQVKASLVPHHPFRLAPRGSEAVADSIRDLGREIGQSYFGNVAAIESMVNGLLTSYYKYMDEERFKKPPPENALTAYEYIHELKSDIASSGAEEAVIVVADRTVGSWLFMPALPAAEEDADEDASHNLRTLMRPQLKRFNYAGVAWAHWILEDRMSDPPQAAIAAKVSQNSHPLPYFSEFHIDHQTDVDYGKNLDGSVKGLVSIPFDDAAFVSKEVNAHQHLLPDTATWTTFNMHKKKQRRFVKWYSNSKPRLMSVVTDTGASPAYGEIRWATPWGFTKGFVDIDAVTLVELGDGSLKMSSSSRNWILTAQTTEITRAFKQQVEAARQLLSSADSMTE